MMVAASTLILSSFICASRGPETPNPVSISSLNGSITESIVHTAPPTNVETRVLANQFSVERVENHFEIIDSGNRKILEITPDSNGRFADATDGTTQFRCALNSASADIIKPSSEKPYCQAHKEPGYFLERYSDAKNRMAFPNGPYGLINGGLCWWMSRFERNAVMLAVFKPELPKPNREQADKLISMLRSTKKVVEIPGFANFHDFTAAFKDDIIKALDWWQINDGIFSFAWVRGLYGYHEVEPAVLQNTMDRTFALVEGAHRPTFQLLQMAGITAHSWIVLAMEKQPDGYNILVADSNFNDALMWHEYRHDMRQLTFYKAVPYLQKTFNDEADEAFSVGSRYCGN
jgi:hypothetical protein